MAVVSFILVPIFNAILRCEGERRKGVDETVDFGTN